MTRPAYYNEIDPYCCHVLRDRIAEGHLPNGTVDERDIRTVDPHSLNDYGQIHLFAGIGGGAVACRLAGIADDFRLITAGVPCQPASVAGQQLGADDDRWLWPEALAFLRALGRHHALLENPPGLLTLNDGREFGTILGELAEIGRPVEWDCVSAASVGAHHQRERLWVIAYASREGLRLESELDARGLGQTLTREYGAYWPVADAYGAGLGERRGTEPVRPELAPAERSGEALADADRAREQQPEGRIEGRGGRAGDSGAARAAVADADRFVRHEGRARDAAEGETRGDTDRSRIGLDADADRLGRDAGSVQGSGEADEGRAREAAGGSGGRESQSGLGRVADGLPDRLDAPVEPFPGWQEEPAIPRVAEKVPHRVDRLRGLGNAWVPQAAVPALLIIKARGGE